MDCNALTKAFPRMVHLSSSPEYENSTKSYFFAFENELQPAYVLVPKVAQDVVDIIKYLQNTLTGVNIAIRGGGHTPWAGASNMGSGVTIGLSDFSYFSESTGFVCDNVVNFQVVLSSGDVVQANKDSHSDLFCALKGGTNTFGTVTRFDLPAFLQGKTWGGAFYYLSATYAGIVQDFYNFASAAEPDPDAHVIAATAYSPLGPVDVVNVYYAKPSSNPPSLAPFTALQPQLANTLREDSLLGFAKELSNFSTNGDRQLFFTTSIRLDKQLIIDMKSLYDNTVESIKTVPGLVLSMVLKPLTRHMLQKSAARRPNSLGLSVDDGPMVITLLDSVYADATDDVNVINDLA
ncbi:hypothetical protein HBI81_058700 [Parastagonospora nodorum]|nr:hypothetical protein HBI10_031740 [Parastagonospora nodorum]KAH4033188.1 hypothetical protein HBI13_007360 [Parastagonospora nodorum]KAH5280562.1 hypothetical protein HBI72_021740 [Parastagonospora nodorum]KAH5515432.1 hypothetical protein HBI31_005750 [Parastagonospora nodorum]KAH5532185.1 hypothetical protein HBI52_008960 [Parastagonospora nodorum]